MGDGHVERGLNPPGHVVVRRSSSLNSIADATRSLAEMLGGEFRRLNARRGEGLLHRTWYVCMYTLGAIRNGAGGGGGDAPERCNWDGHGMIGWRTYCSVLLVPIRALRLSKTSDWGW